MEDGFYWYFPSPDDQDHWCGELRPDSEPTIFQVYEDRILVSDISVDVEESHGTWIGPLQQPDKSLSKQR